MVTEGISQTSRRVAKNTVFLYLRMLVLMLIGLFTSRIILNGLGVEDFGTYNAVYSMVMMFTVVSNSVSNSTSRYMAYALGQEDSASAHKVFSAAILIQIGMALLLVLVAETLGLWYLNEKLVIPAGRETAAFWVMQCSVLLLIVQFFSLPFNATIIAHEHMEAFAFISIFEAVLKLTVAFAIAFSSYDRLVFYAILMVLVALVTRSAYAIYCRRHYQETRGRLHTDRTTVSGMLGISGWSFLGNGVVVLNTQGISLLSNAFFGVTVNTARGLAGQVENLAKQFVSNFLTALNPQIIKSWARNEKEYCYSLVAKGCKFSILIMLIFTIPICVEGELLMKWWLGNVPEYAVFFTKLALIAVIADMMANSVFQLVLANGKVAGYYVATSLVSLLAFVLSWMLFRCGATPEAAYWLLITVTLASNIVKIYIARERTGLPVLRFLREAYAGPAFVALCGAAICLCINAIMTEGALRLCCNVIACTLSTLLLSYAAVLTKGEKKFVRESLSRWKR